MSSSPPRRRRRRATSRRVLKSILLPVTCSQHARERARLTTLIAIHNQKSLPATGTQHRVPVVFRYHRSIGLLRSRPPFLLGDRVSMPSSSRSRPVPAQDRVNPSGTLPLAAPARSWPNRDLRAGGGREGGGGAGPLPYA